MEKSRYYEVDSIVGKKDHKGKAYYKVRWVGYGQKDDTWEPEENLKNCEDAITAYMNKNKTTTPVKPPRVLNTRSLGRTTPSSRRYQTTMSDITPSRYYLRPSTIVQKRPPINNDYMKRIAPPLAVERYNIHEDAPREETRPIIVESSPQSSPPPSWMQLGLVEMIFCLLFVAIVLGLFWAFQNSLQDSSTTPK